MTPANDGGPAFPLQSLPAPGSEVAWGMSLRDWFAGQALMGWVAGRSNPWGALDTSGWVAAQCYACADVMLRAREGGAK